MTGGERIIAWGELLWDCLPNGRQLGGAPANFAFHAANLGADARLVSRVGSDALGDEALALLAERGVATDLVQRDAEHATGTVTVTFEAGEPQYEIHGPAAWDRIELAPELNAALARADVFCFGTLAQRTREGRAALRAALAQLPESCLRLCDLNLRPGPGSERRVIEAALTAATVHKLNQAEVETLEALFAVPAAPAWLVREHGSRLVAITRGDAGSRFVIRSGAQDHPAEPLTSADGDPVGAGDAFTAVLAVGLARGVSLAEIGPAANRYAAHVASCRGAMPSAPEALLAGLWPD